MKYKHLTCGKTFRHPHSNGQYVCSQCKGWMCNCEECIGCGYEIVFEPGKLLRKDIKKLKRWINTLIARFID